MLFVFYICLSANIYGTRYKKTLLSARLSLYSLRKYLTPKDKWVTKNLLVAHQQNAPAKSQACCEEIRTATYDNMPNFTTAYGADLYKGGNNATNDTIVSRINDGFGVVNYRGHGVVEGWQHEWNNLNICFDSAEIIKLKNRNKETIIFSIACSTADINNNNSLYKVTF